MKKYNLTDIEDFITEILGVINNSTDKKSLDIRNYLKDEYIDFYSLIQITNDYKEEFDKTKIENNKVISTNLGNIASKLVEKSMPFIKDYIAQNFPKLNILSRIELKSGMLKKLKNALLDEIKKDKNGIFPKGINFDTVAKLVNRFQNEDINLSKIFPQEQAGPLVILATSFLNLATTVKTYYDERYEYDEKMKDFTNKFDEIHKEFEILKDQIGTLDLDNYEESMTKIITIGKKMNENKQKISSTIDDLEKKEKELKENDKGSILKKVAKEGVGAIGCIAAFFATGGLFSIPLATAAIFNAVNCGINIQRLINLKKQLEKYNETKKKETQKSIEIDKQLEILMKKYDQIQHRFIPKNLLKDFE